MYSLLQICSTPVVKHVHEQAALAVRQHCPINMGMGLTIDVQFEG